MIDRQQLREAREALGRMLATRRKARGMIQSEVARAVLTTRSTVGMVERGRQIVDRVFWQQCESVLGAGGELVAAYDAYRQLERQFRTEQESAARKARWGALADTVTEANVSGPALTTVPSAAELPLSEITSGGPRQRATEDSSTPATTTGWFRPNFRTGPLRIALCGSRSTGVNNALVDDAVAAVSRLLMNHRCTVDHGPVGIGIEIMTYIADHYRPPALQAAVGLFGRPNVVRNADFLLIIGGGRGTLDEVDVATSMGKKMLPFAASGGTARDLMDRMQADVTLRSWLPGDMFAALATCAGAEDFTKLVEQIISTDLRSFPRE
jgi:transcriptional regulator with XRE-family HTH domain